MSRTFSGIYPVLYAFFNADGTLDEGAMAIQVDHCLAAGAHGICVLGLVTEVNKLDSAARRHLVEVVGGLLRGRAPYAVTIGEPTSQGQIEFAKMAKQAGADWVILQPPPGPQREDALIDFFRETAAGIDGEVAIQNNPVNLASSLTVEGVLSLMGQAPNVTLVKAEGWSVDIARLTSETDGSLSIFGGHGGLEFISLMLGGGHGLIPAPDCLALQVRMFELLVSGDSQAQAAAERIHQALLPEIIFMTRNVPGLVYYGKRLFASKLGITTLHDLGPTIKPTAFGLSETTRLADRLHLLELEHGLDHYSPFKQIN